MKSNDEIQDPSNVLQDQKEYEPPRLTVIGEACQVVLGIPGAADDYYGYSLPRFEFEPDGDDSNKA
ncbi:MAG: hypothetical protein ACRD1T_13845 [Acidimicrobiia bacterium]